MQGSMAGSATVPPVQRTEGYRQTTMALLCGLMAAMVLVMAPRAQALEELDRIVAVVEDDVILASELISRANNVREQMRATNASVPPEPILYSQVLDRLVTESIQMQMGQRAGIRIDDESLTNAIENIARQNGMNLTEFQRALAADGISYREFRDDVRREMVIGQVQRNAVGRRVSITEEEIRAFLDSPVGRQMTADEYRVGHMLLAVPDNASEQQVQQRAELAESLYEQLQEGADFRELAITHSADARALEGGDLGWRRAGELPSLFADQVLELRPGATLRPIRSSSGFHIVQVFDRRGAGAAQVQQTKARHILVQPTEIRTDQEARAILETVRERLDDGEDFAELARIFSEDPGSALAGGDLGWSESERYVPAFAEVMDNAEIGEVQGPFRTEYGWHLLKVEDRREQDMGREARRNMAGNALHNRRFEEELQSWIAEIRDESYVELRL